MESKSNCKFGEPMMCSSILNTEFLQKQQAFGFLLKKLVLLKMRV